MSTSRPDNLAPRTNTKKKKKSGLSGFLAAICGTDKGHETESARPAGPKPVEATPTATSEATKQQDKATNPIVAVSQSSTPVEPQASGSKSNGRIDIVQSETAGTTPLATNAVVPPVEPQTMLAVPTQSGSDADAMRGSSRMDVDSSSNDAVRASAAAVTLGTAYPMASSPQPIHPVSAVNEMAQAGGVGRDSPAQELGMTDVEMGGEHDRSDEGVIVPAGAATDGVKVPLEEVSPSNEIVFR